MKPTESEKTALKTSARLLQFAAENKTPLPIDTIKAIETAWEAEANGTWDANVAASFLVAYTALCTHVSPVNLDTLLAADPRVIDEGPPAITTKSLSRIWATRFGWLLVALIFVITCLGFITSSAETLVKELTDLQTQADKEVKTVEAKSYAVRTKLVDKGQEVTTNFNTQTISRDTRDAIFELISTIPDLYFSADRMYQKANAFGFRLLGIPTLEKCPENYADGGNCYHEGPLTNPSTLAEVQSNIVNYYNTRRNVVVRRDQANTRLGVLKAYLLPLLLGMLGACAYVIRTISDQIKDSTFSSNSPTRHILRVAIGSTAGLVVSFGIFSTPNLSASALAFIAGYSIEAVFALFDGILAKLK